MFRNYNSTQVRPNDYPLYDVVQEIITIAVDTSDDKHEIVEELVESLWPLFAYLVSRLDKSFPVPSERLIWR